MIKNERNSLQNYKHSATRYTNKSNMDNNTQRKINPKTWKSERKEISLFTQTSPCIRIQRKGQEKCSKFLNRLTALTFNFFFSISLAWLFFALVSFFRISRRKHEYFNRQTHTRADKQAQMQTQIHIQTNTRLQTYPYRNRHKHTQADHRDANTGTHKHANPHSLAYTDTHTHIHKENPCRYT